jgi:2-phospho-L-lactate/phosphoenolpyruvate guanylyltransferase
MNQSGTVLDNPTVPVVLIPIKDFRRAKRRLAPELTPDKRENLAKRMASQVIKAARPLDIYIVCNDHDVANWAESNNVNVLWVNQEGLNQSISGAVEELDTNIGHVLIAHSDLPLAKSFAGIGRPNTVSIVPDRHLLGTNVLSLPLGSNFNFRYGQNSLSAHIDETKKHGLNLEILQIPELQWDVDTPEDLLTFLKPRTT